MAEAKAAGDCVTDDLLQQFDALHVTPEPTSGSSRAVSSPQLKRPEAQPVDISGRPLVYFDLETTGLDLGCHITQIAAIRGQDTFSRYVVPKIPIDSKAQEITGITCRGKTMCHHDNQVECVTITQALQEFLDFLGTEKQVLVGHNARIFDCPRLINPMKACGLLDRFREVVYCFVDTLPLFRDFGKSLTSHRLGSLYQHYVGREFDAHDAREDVKALQEIVTSARVPLQKMSQHSFTLTYITDLQGFNIARSRLLRDWKPLVEGGFLTKGMAERAAGSGLKFEDLRGVFQRDGKEGVKRALQQSTDDGQPRVANVNKTLTGICNYLESEQGTAANSPHKTNTQHTTTYSSSPRVTSSSPRPASSSPRPTSGSPRPTSSSPRPASSSPRPTSSSPRPASSSPRPTSGSPRPTSSSPRPTSSFPHTTASSPRPASSSPRPTSSSPRPTSSSPRPASSSPRTTSSSPSKKAISSTSTETR